MQAALVVIGAIAVIGGPILWWIFFRMDEHPSFPSAPETPPRAMSAADVARIEQALGVALPVDYAAFVQGERPLAVDTTSVIDDADLVIELTREYRAGYYGLPPWPARFVYIGDECDASPYVLDCTNGECMQVEKGNLAHRPISRHRSFVEFVASLAD